MFATDINSLDYRTHNPQTVVRRVMALLERRGRGIILFHDIHGSTAAALPTLLLQLKAKGFKVVHLTPKARRPTIANTSHRHPTCTIRGHRRKSLPNGLDGADEGSSSVGENGVLAFLK